MGDFDKGYELGWQQASEVHRKLIASVAETARLWAMSMSGNTPLALIAAMLRELDPKCEEHGVTPRDPGGAP